MQLTASRLRNGVTVAIVLATFAGTAHAELPSESRADPTPVDPTPVDSRKTEAADRFDRGLALFDDGNNAAALAEFLAAYELVKNPVVRLNVGLVYAAMGRSVEAVDVLTEL